VDINESPVLSLHNVCGIGVADERFQREVALVLENIKDENVPADAKRSITMTFTFEGFQKRSGAAVTLDIKTKLAPTEGVDGTVFFTRRGDELVAVPLDENQERFDFESEMRKGGK
jgi:hypothetical protein